MNLKLIFVSGALATLLGGCATAPRPRLDHITGDSVVFIGDNPAALALIPASWPRLAVRSTYLPGSNTVNYIQGRDFDVDYKTGTLMRTTTSRLPDFRKNILYGQDDFDHSQFPGFGNREFFAYADYTPAAALTWPVQPSQIQFLQATLERLKAGESLKIVAFGDSITAGGDATKPELFFWQRWADGLQKRYHRAQISIINGATGGDTTVQGLQRLKAKVLDQKPDLVLIAFGMNDHNIGSVPVPQFEQNLKRMISRIRAQTSAEIIMLSAFPPNRKWKFGSHHMQDYAAATSSVAVETRCAYADVFGNWQSLAARKKPEDWLANNINHPNDFGHWIYFKVLEALGL
jgi:acyl-CoA thioesterase-1